MPADYTALPTAAYVEAWIGNALQMHAAAIDVDLTVYDYEAAIDAAAAEFEHATDRVLLPVTETRYFDPPVGGRGRVYLGMDLLGSPAPALSVGGVLQVVNNDYVLRPYGGGGDFKPYQAFDLRTSYYNNLNWRHIAINGKWGYGATIPPDVWLALVARAAWILYPTQMAALVGIGVSWREADVDESYGQKPMAYYVEALEAQWKAVVGPHKRVAVG